MKITILLTLFISQLVHGAVTAKWFGITSTYITDGKTAILFDPTVTRPSLLTILTFRDINSDLKLVKKWISELELKNVKGVFVSHSHADHILDAPNFTRELGSTLYGSRTTLNIGRGFNLPEKSLKKFKVGDIIKIGDFTIEVIKCVHSPLVFGFQLFPGEVTKPLKLPNSYSAFKMGGSFVFHIKHPKGNMFFHPSASIAKDTKDYSKLQADIVFQGIGSRRSTKYLYDSVMKKVGAKRIIPVHFDDFFDKDVRTPSMLPTVDIDEFSESSAKLYPAGKVEFPKIGKEIILFQ